MAGIRNIESPTFQGPTYVELEGMDYAEAIQEPKKKTSKASQIVQVIHKIASAILMCCLPTDVDATMASGYFGECSYLHMNSIHMKHN